MIVGMVMHQSYYVRPRLDGGDFPGKVRDVWRSSPYPPRGHRVARRNEHSRNDVADELANVRHFVLW
eukprot:maker-scaffold438_size171652-snap-gene-0.38 protein:Tk03134 transcript:maker-scaffold438_size171652-snap-gene-0.38-mRNA-1 annotation:"---NA---"